jgi:hypothetical protein
MRKCDDVGPRRRSPRELAPKLRQILAECFILRVSIGTRRGDRPAFLRLDASFVRPLPGNDGFPSVPAAAGPTTSNRKHQGVGAEASASFFERRMARRGGDDLNLH